MHGYPQARLDGLVITDAGDDQLVYDERTAVIHNLNAHAHTIWTLADGSRDIAAIMNESGMAKDSVIHGLNLLAEANLLDGNVQRLEQRASRRRLIRNAGLAAIPAIISVTAPAAAWNQSCGSIQVPWFEPCDHAPQCCLGTRQCCKNGSEGNYPQAICQDHCN